MPGRKPSRPPCGILGLFRRRWPAVVRALIAGRYPPEQAPDLILGRPAGIKSVISGR